MKNIIDNAIVRNLFGKALMIGFLTSMLVAASYAQAQTNIYYANSKAKYGRVYAYNGSHFEIYTNNSVIKTFSNSCRPASSGGVAGLVCTFGEFRNGEHNLSGWAYFFQNGIVYLTWTNERVAGNQWRNINTGWYMFVPGP